MKLRLLVGMVGMLMLANIADAAPFAYVLNRGSSHPTQPAPGTLTVIDVGATPTVVGSPISLGGRPYSIAVSSLGARFYIANQGGATGNDQSIKIYDADMLTEVAALNNLTYVPGGIALNKAETRLYVADQTNSRVIVYDLNGTSLSEAGYLAVDNSGTATKPEGIVVDETAGRLFVANSMVDQLAAFDLTLVDAAAKNHDSTARLANVTLTGCNSPTGLALAGSKVYVSCSMSSNVATFASATPTAVTTISVGAAPFGITANSDGSKVYVANSADNISRVTIIATADNSKTTVNANTAKNNFACSVAEAPDKSRYYITNVPANEAGALATDVHDVSVVPVGGTTATSLNAGVNPCSFGNFMGPALPHTLTLAHSGGTITPNKTANSATDTVYAATGSYKTFTVTPTAPNNSVLSVTDSAGKNYGAAEKFTVGPIASNLTITVAFTSLTKYDLTALVDGGGYCTITSSPEGINVYPPEYSAIGNFASGTSVVLTAAAFTGSEFKGWTSGCDVVSGNTCTVNMTAAVRTVRANCEPAPLCSDFLRDSSSYDSLGAAHAAGGGTLIKVGVSPSKSTTPVDISGTQSVKLDGGYDLCGTGAKGLGVISTLPITTLTISTTGTVEISEIAIQ